MAARRLADLIDVLPASPPWPQALDGPVLVVLADDAPARARLGAAALRRMAALVTVSLVEPAPASEWPFTHPLVTPG